MVKYPVKEVFISVHRLKIFYFNVLCKNLRKDIFLSILDLILMMKDGYPLTKKSIRYRFKRIYQKKYTFGANKNLTGLKTYLRTEVLIDNHYNPLNPEKLVSFIKVHPFKEP